MEQDARSVAPRLQSKPYSRHALGIGLQRISAANRAGARTAWGVVESSQGGAPRNHLASHAQILFEAREISDRQGEGAPWQRGYGGRGSAAL